jgi:hypothetical protein
MWIISYENLNLKSWNKWERIKNQYTEICVDMRQLPCFPHSHVNFIRFSLMPGIKMNKIQSFASRYFETCLHFVSDNKENTHT